MITSAVVGEVWVDRARRFALIIGACCLVIGLVVLVIGWWLGVEPVKQIVPGAISMKANAAAGIALAGLGVLAAAARWPRWISGATGAVLVVVGLTTVIETAVGSTWNGLDELLVGDPVRFATVVPGRMAINSAFNFALIGMALVLWTIHRLPSVRQVLGGVVAGVALVGTLGYIMSDWQLTGLDIASVTRMALHTAVSQLALGVSLVAVDIGQGWAKAFASPRPGGRLLRLFFPVAVALSLVGAALVRVFLASATLHAHAPQFAIVFLTFTFLALMGVSARRIDSVDAEREALALNIEQRVTDGTLDARQASALLRAQFDAAPLGVALVSLSGVLLEANESLSSMLGIDREGLLGQKVLTLVQPQDRAAQQGDIHRLVMGDTSALSVERRYRHQDGHQIWVRESVAAVREDDGTPVLLVMNIEDIDRRRAQELRYRLLADNSTDMVVMVDVAGVFTWVSPATRRVLGFEPNELVGTDGAQLIHPEDLPLVQAVRLRVANGEQGIAYELRLRNRSGEYRWLSAVSGPVFDDDGLLVGRLITQRDIHERVLAREALARSEGLFRVAMNGSPQGMAVVGLHLRFLQVNPVLCAMLGRDESWLLAHTVRDIVHPDELEADLAGRDELVSGDAGSQVHERRWLKADGSYLWVVHSTALLCDEYDMPLFYVSHIQDNTDAHNAQVALTSRANHDPLTGLINRDQLQAHLTHVLTRPRPSGGPPAVLFCDLDYFKNINDTYGHDAGDEVIRVTANRITSTLRSSDVAARLGGDEFVVILDAIPDQTTAITVAEKIRAAIAEPIPIGADGSITIAASIGIVLATADVDAQRLLRNADAALYEAKNAGRDQISVFHDASTSKAETDIRAGLADGLFIPWFQPIVNLADGVLVGYEALARWVRPDGSVIAPDGFLLDAQRSNLIIDLDQAILEQSLGMLSKQPARLHVAVNVSAATLSADEYANKVIAALTSSGVDPAWLHLEFTEATLLSVTTSVRKTMTELAHIGVHWYVDNFGTGCSSISHLRDLPIAGLKLDLSFTSELGSSDPTGKHLAKALAGLANGLGLDTVAEGIETQQQAAILIAQGWQHGQGWLYGHPETL